MTANPTLADVTARRVKIAEEIEALRAEDHDLEVAERVLQRLSGIQAASSKPEEKVELTSMRDAAPLRASDAMRASGSTESRIMVFLLEKSKTGWATSNEVKEWLDWRTGRDVPMSTVSPTLSNLKNKRLIVRDGLKVAALARVSKNRKDQAYADGPVPGEDDLSDNYGDANAAEAERESNQTEVDETVAAQVSAEPSWKTGSFVRRPIS